MSDEDIKKVMQETSREMMSSFGALMKKHGPDKIMFANSVVNCPKLLRLLRESDAPESLVTLVEAQLRMMLACWSNARNYGPDIDAIADGIRGQEAILEQNLLDAVQTADGGSPTKE